MKKKKKMNMSSDFNKCKTCSYFPDISISMCDYFVDQYGVKHRNMKYICKYDLHEIKTRTNQCPRCNNEAD